MDYGVIPFVFYGTELELPHQFAICLPIFFPLLYHYLCRICSIVAHQWSLFDAYFLYVFFLLMDVLQQESTLPLQIFHFLLGDVLYRILICRWFLEIDTFLKNRTCVRIIMTCSKLKLNLVGLISCSLFLCIWILLHMFMILIPLVKRFPLGESTNVRVVPSQSLC